MCVSRSEVDACEYLRAALADLAVGEVITDRKITRNLGGLDFYLPQLLRGTFSFWKHESIDGICPIYVRKMAELTVEIVGSCILISDQTVTPIHLRLRVSAESDSFEWLECRLGEKGPDGEIRRVKYTSAWPLKPLLHIQDDPDAIDWCFAVTFGERTH